MTEAIAGGCYAKRSLVSYASFAGVPDSCKTSEAERLVARRIITAKPENRLVLPMARTVCPLLKYAELHGKRNKLCFQLHRNACVLPSRLGRLCAHGDYAPFGDKLPFKPCSKRVLRGEQLPFIFVLMPTLGKDGHYLRGGERRLIDPERIVDPPSAMLKVYYKTESTHPSPDDEVRPWHRMFCFVISKGSLHDVCENV
ncbi:hypothetical protein CYMTET_30716 [Cymbomonas tetramitiformis]|uniref:Uncharacterized protein n=1 Tax=Cymbomonas tetramitiformis TaxID=36881 RepID=A0AAE0FI97_9CHLO|nr:hypothetical protein CYMTET_30716 [Cymbomonas tetramitiformis]